MAYKELLNVTVRPNPSEDESHAERRQGAAKVEKAGSCSGRIEPTHGSEVEKHELCQRRALREEGGAS